MKMEWKVFVFLEKNGNGEKPTFRFVGSRHRAKPTFNHVCRVRVSPPPWLDPTRSLGMPLIANRVYDNFPACLSMDRAMEY